MDPTSSSSIPGLKVAIPRLRRDGREGSVDGVPGAGVGRRNSVVSGSSGEKHRVSHACEPCRQRKTKCSGERPVCRHCEDFKISCHYGDGKRDKARNEIKSLQEKVEIYEKLLNHVTPQVDNEAQHAINRALKRKASFQSWTTGSPLVGTHDTGMRGEQLVSAEVGSIGSMDRNEIEFSPGYLPQSGYMGKNTDVAWLRRIEKQYSGLFMNKDQTADPGLNFGQGTQDKGKGRADNVMIDGAARGSKPSAESAMLSHYTYQLDDLNLSNKVLDVENAFALPPPKIANALIDVYFSTIHQSFPILSQPQFVSQYNKFMTDYELPDQSKAWLALLNVIFAIGTIYSHLILADWKGDAKDHLQYLGRAQALFLNSGVLFNVPTVVQIQALAVTGIYLIATNQTNRAWTVTGLAVRSAFSLGLHLRSEGAQISAAEEELRHRKWYALFVLERLCCVLTGRPMSVQETHYNVPLPSIVDETIIARDAMEAKASRSATTSTSTVSGQSLNMHSSLAGIPKVPAFTDAPQGGVRSDQAVPPAAFFLETVKLNKISSEILSRLYSAGTVKLRWSDVQAIIQELDTRLNTWRVELPSGLVFGKRQRDQVQARQRMLLSFEYFNAKMLVHRPCLCKLDGRIPMESAQSVAFNQAAAQRCVQAAFDTISLLPDQPNVVGLTTSGPWWCLMYYLVSAGIVLMIEMLFRAEHVPGMAENLIKDCQRLINWLQVMGQDNLAARRSCETLSHLMAYAAPCIGAPKAHFAGTSIVQSRTTGSPNDPFSATIETTERPAKRRTQIPDMSPSSYSSSSAPSSLLPQLNTIDDDTIKTLIQMLAPLRPSFFVEDSSKFNQSQATRSQSRNGKFDSSSHLSMPQPAPYGVMGQQMSDSSPLIGPSPEQQRLQLQQQQQQQQQQQSFGYNTHTSYRQQVPSVTQQSPLQQPSDEWWRYMSQDPSGVSNPQQSDGVGQVNPPLYPYYQQQDFAEVEKYAIQGNNTMERHMQDLMHAPMQDEMQDQMQIRRHLPSDPSSHIDPRLGGSGSGSS